MIKNNKPYTNENGWEDKDLLSDLPMDQQHRVLSWIKNRIKPRKTKNFRHSSYGLKHYLQDEIGIYLTNNQFKDAMMMCGFYPIDPDKLNWNYCISEKSTAFMR